MGPKPPKKNAAPLPVDTADGATIAYVTLSVAKNDFNIMLNSNCKLDLFLYTAKQQLSKLLLEKVSALKLNITTEDLDAQDNMILELENIRNDFNSSEISSFDLLDFEQKPQLCNTVSLFNYFSS